MSTQNYLPPIIVATIYFIMAMLIEVKPRFGLSGVAYSLVHTIHRYCTQANHERLADRACGGVL